MTDKSTLDQVATKKDLSNLATRSDLKDTRSDLKADIRRVEKSLRQEILKVEERVENVEESQKRMETKLDKIADTLDGFVGRVDDLTADNEVGVQHTREIRVQVDDHEKRIREVESRVKSPQ